MAVKPRMFVDDPVAEVAAIRQRLARAYKFGKLGRAKADVWYLLRELTRLQDNIAGEALLTPRGDVHFDGGWPGGRFVVFPERKAACGAVGRNFTGSPGEITCGDCRRRLAGGA